MVDYFGHGSENEQKSKDITDNSDATSEGHGIR